MVSTLLKSKQNGSCPICGRSHDTDCRWSLDESLVLCWTKARGGTKRVVEPADKIEAGKQTYTATKLTADGNWMEYVRLSEADNWKKPKRDRGKQEYVYTDIDFLPIVKVVRIDSEGGKKIFQAYRHSWGEWEVGVKACDLSTRKEIRCSDFFENEGKAELMKRIAPYRWREVKEAIAKQQTIFLVEGEGKADLLWKLGIPATTTIGGAGKSKHYGHPYAPYFKNAQVVLCPDRDRVGIAHALELKAELATAGIKTVRWLYAFPNSPSWRQLEDGGGADVADWIAEIQSDKSVDIKSVLTFAIESEREGLTDSGVTPVNLRTDFKAKLENGDREVHTKFLEELRRIDAEPDLTYRENRLHYLAKSLGLRSINHLTKLLELDHLQRPLEEPVETIVAFGTPEAEAEWLVEGMLERGTTVLLTAQSKTGKTPLAYDIAYAVATGQPFLDIFPVRSRGAVLIVQTDESRLAMARNLRRRGLTQVEGVKFVTQFNIEQVDILETWIVKYDPKFVIIDSLTSISLNSSISENDTEYAKNLYKLTHLFAKYRVTGIVTHHRNKSGKGEMDAVSGSHQIPAAVDDNWLLERVDSKSDPDGLLRKLSRIGGHYGEPFKYMLRFDPIGRTWQLLGESAEGNPPYKELDIRPEDFGDSRIRTQVKQFLQGNSSKPHSVAQIAQKLNANYRAVSRIVLSLFDSGWLDRTSSRNFEGKTDWFYRDRYAASVAPESECDRVVPIDCTAIAVPFGCGETVRIIAPNDRARGSIGTIRSLEELSGAQGSYYSYTVFLCQEGVSCKYGHFELERVQ